MSSAIAAIGVLLLTSAAIAAFEGWLYQWKGHRALDALQISRTQVLAAGERGRSAPKRRPARGELLGKLEVPRLKMSVVVLEGSDDAVLKKGPGHVEETALPGELGNVAIAGHRDTHFRPLRSIRLNDEVIVTTKAGSIRYLINNIKIIRPTDMEILDPTPGAALTLITCFPFEFIGNAPMRFVIQATPRSAKEGNSTYAER